jgi:hypothetical protein
VSWLTDRCDRKIGRQVAGVKNKRTGRTIDVCFSGTRMCCVKSVTAAPSGSPLVWRLTQFPEDNNKTIDVASVEFLSRNLLSTVLICALARDISSL